MNSSASSSATLGQALPSVRCCARLSALQRIVLETYVTAQNNFRNHHKKKVNAKWEKLSVTQMRHEKFSADDDDNDIRRGKSEK